MINSSARHELDTVFFPKSVATIGASSNEQKERTQGYTGWLLALGFSGQLYPINPNAPQILGQKAYPSIKDVPGPVDYAIMAVPSSAVPSVLKDCVDKRVRVVHVMTSGFAETGEPEGIRLQKEIEKIIESSSIRLIGPNCLGVYSPAGGLGFGGMMLKANIAKKTGSVSVISQSGIGLDSVFIPGALARDISFGKVVSCGNSVDLGPEDFLDYFADDTKTEAVFCYIEGIKDGRRFFKALDKCSKLKPVILLKGGMTAGGARAAASHTGSLAGSEKIYRALYKQTNVVAVDSFEEAVDQLSALTKLPPIRGTRIAIAGRGGGPGVVITDMFERAGLSVSHLAKETTDKLAKMLPPGSGWLNPVEIGPGFRGVPENYYDVLSIIANDDNIDMILARINFEAYYQYTDIDKQMETLVNLWVKACENLGKPMAIVFDRGEQLEPIILAVKAREACSKAGLACFLTLESAVKAISKAAMYYKAKHASSI